MTQIPAAAVAEGASIRKEIEIQAPPALVWDALADFHAVHLRVAPGFLTDLKSDGESARIVTFSNGAVAREVLVSSDPGSRRLVYAIPGARFVSYSASIQVFETGHDASRVVWIVDVLPNDFADYIDRQMSLALPIMKATLEAAARP
jgi:carbon monoxide dehydrogenase subunit G